MATQSNDPTKKGSAGQGAPAADLTSSGGAGQSSSGDGGSGAASSIQEMKASTQTILEQTKATASEVYDSVSEKAATALDDKKSGFSEGLSSAADTVRKFSSTVNQSENPNRVTELASEYSETAADKLEDVAKYFETTDWRAMARDVETFARRNPAVFLGGAFALGVLAARFLKSSPSGSRRSNGGLADQRARKTQDLGNSHAAM